ncbi:hypothetical protein [Psychroflexus tropicus]|uniref:hypothetical protein n=1 Tax=Psychroflexus tropicus TaxID=197345 RepID=UPI0003A35B56|nr:hypothetical protein [Psychroflexus tropicus]
MSSIFKSHPIPNGNSWTITSKLGHILRTAEEKYGERDKSYTILGVEFTTNGNPQIWYPDDCKHVVIQITENCINDINRAVFQVAHESIHCLCPTGSQNANVLEEGLANLFSIIYCRENGHGNNWTSNAQSYTNASNLVEKLLSIDADIIKKLRAIEPTLSKVDKDLMIRVNPDITSELADKLTKKF